jgi:hypothetical protein
MNNYIRNSINTNIKESFGDKISRLTNSSSCVSSSKEKIEAPLLNNSYRVMTVAEVTTMKFCGEKLVIVGTKGGYRQGMRIPETQKFPLLKELHTEVYFSVFPNVRSLGLRIREQPNLELIKKIPPSVEALRLFIQRSVSLKDN